MRSALTTIFGMYYMQVGGSAILPGAAMFEACATAAATLQDESRGRAQLALQGVSIAAPLRLEQQGPAAAATVLQCSVDAAVGTVELTSMQPAARRQQSASHCRGAVAVASHAGSHVVQPTADRPNTALLAMALHKQPRPQSSSSPSATLSIATSASSGYFLHPAAADATLHLLAAAAAPTSSATSAAAQPITRVPTGLGCLVVPQIPVSGTLHPLASPEAKLQQPRPDSSLRCSFRLQAAVLGAALAYQLCDLVIKEMPATPPQPAATAAASGKHQTALASDTEILYEIQWQAANNAAAHETVSSPVGQQLLWRPSSGKSAQIAATATLSKQANVMQLSAEFAISAAASPASAATATMRGLELLQRTAAQLPASSSLQFTTKGAAQLLPAAGQQQAGIAAATGAAVAALAKVAANEYPAAGISSLDVAAGTAPAVVMSGSTKVPAVIYITAFLRITAMPVHCGSGSNWSNAPMRTTPPQPVMK